MFAHIFFLNHLMEIYFSVKLQKCVDNYTNSFTFSSIFISIINAENISLGWLPWMFKKNWFICGDTEIYGWFLLVIISFLILISVDRSVWRNGLWLSENWKLMPFILNSSLWMDQQIIVMKQGISLQRLSSLANFQDLTEPKNCDKYTESVKYSVGMSYIG